MVAFITSPIDTLLQPATRARASSRTCTVVPTLPCKPNSRCDLRGTKLAPNTRWGSRSRDPIGFHGGDFCLFNYVKAKSLTSIDPAGLRPITCRCHGYSPRDAGGGPFTVDRKVECANLATTCCPRACGELRWENEWWIGDPVPEPDMDTCPEDWGRGTDFLTCVACCVRTYEFWNSGAIACGIGGIRIPKRHVQPGQTPTSTWLLKPRRCFPKWCRPTMRTTRIVGRCSGVLFIIEGCYDLGIEGSCAVYCAARSQ
jgi:hypothetical protein